MGFLNIRHGIFKAVQWLYRLICRRKSCHSGNRHARLGIGNHAFKKIGENLNETLSHGFEESVGCSPTFKIPEKLSLVSSLSSSKPDCNIILQNIYSSCRFSLTCAKQLWDRASNKIGPLLCSPEHIEYQSMTTTTGLRNMMVKVLQSVANYFRSSYRQQASRFSSECTEEWPSLRHWDPGCLRNERGGSMIVVQL